MIETPFNLDYSKEIIISIGNSSWEESPNPQVQRIYLEREAPESGIATSFVKYLPNSNFKKHFHPGGEEIFVIEGTFSDETGDYRAGTYFRNPQGTFHSPYSQKGCTIFVKLCQFKERDTQQLALTPKSQSLLHEYKNETTEYKELEEDSELNFSYVSTEILVISGEFIYKEKKYCGTHWLRLPKTNTAKINFSKSTKLLIKKNHF